MGYPGPDERPALEQRPVQMVDPRSIRYELPMRLEGGARGRVDVRWTEDGDLFAAVSGSAVRLVQRIRQGWEEAE